MRTTLILRGTGTLPSAHASPPPPDGRVHVARSAGGLDPRRAYYSRFPQSTGAPVHIGLPNAIGISRFHCPTTADAWNPRRQAAVFLALRVRFPRRFARRKPGSPSPNAPARCWATDLFQFNHQLGHSRYQSVTQVRDLNGVPSAHEGVSDHRGLGRAASVLAYRLKRASAVPIRTEHAQTR